MALQTISKGLTKVFGSRNDRLIKKYHRRVEQINALEPTIRAMTDAEIRERVADIRQKASATGDLGDDLPEAMAIMRESLDRNVGIRNIFNPETQDQFPLEKLTGDARAAYDRVAAEIEQRPDEFVLGSEAPVPGWLQVDIPNVLYDAVREIYPQSRPPFRARSFDVQLIGGMVLYEGRIAEMKTGEGKTIVAPLACFGAALEGLQSHVITVNDYLVQRDRDWVFPAFHRLGLTVGAIHPQHMQPAQVKQKMYDCDVVYGTNSEFGFDYLRDNMKLAVEEQVQKRRDFCIVDEIDSILIDEARTPLIISGPAHDDAPQYQKADQVAQQLVALQKTANAETAKRIQQEGFIDQQARHHRVAPNNIEKVVSKFRDLGPDFLDEKEAEQIEHTQYYVAKKEQKQASMTHLGVEEAQKIVGTRFYVVGNDMAWDHLINQAIRAHVVYEKDREYVVRDGEVVIVDEFTGRLMVGRQWSDGLHQAVEAKEAKNGVKIKEETQTLATITIQNFFKLYKRLAGMTGTAVTEAGEFMEIYDLDVVAIPTNRPVIRDDQEDLIFLTAKEKWNAICDEIKETSEQGRPVLVGTTSVDKSQLLSHLLTERHKLDHEVLNAKQHEREATIVAKAGHTHQDQRGRTVGNVTISTNMAGRGTDIRLSPEVLEAGGLHIVGTERHESRRIDNQLRGRAGRQGDPGASRFFLSMEDDLMKMFAGGKTMKALQMFGMQENEAIEHKWISRSVERAQRKVEDRNFQIRKNLLEYDEVMEYQRTEFYGTRQRVLEGRHIPELVQQYLTESIEDAVGRFLDPGYPAEQAAAAARSILNLNIEAHRLRNLDTAEDVASRVRGDAKSEIRSEIENAIGEFISDDIPPEDWDLSGMQSWAMTRYQVDLKQAQLREMDANQVAEHLTEAAYEQVDRKPLDSLARFYEPDYAGRELADWAQRKFDLEIAPDQLQAGSSESADAAQQRVAELIFRKVSEQYDRREIEYPVRFALDMAFSMAQQQEGAGERAAAHLHEFGRQRYGMDWTLDDVKRMTGDQLFQALRDAAEPWYGGKLQQWASATVAEHGDDLEALGDAFEQRWGAPLDAEQLADLPTERREAHLMDEARRILRAELTQLERYVLLQTLDQTWKDHLYAMDQLKRSISLRSFGQRDPKVEFKREGSNMFQEMQETVRDKVTDMILRARLTPNVQASSAYREQAASHQAPQGTGVGAAAGQAADAVPQASGQQEADLEAAESAGAERAPVQTIVNKGEKFGRNEMVIVEGPEGQRQEVKYKKAERMQNQGWRIVSKA